MAEWNFELRTGGPDYFWNRVCLYIGRHEQRLETQELGALRVEVPRDLRAPRTDVLDANYAVLATVLTDLPPALTEEEIAAFLDPNLLGPKTVRLPHYVKLFWCSLTPLAADRLAVHIETLIDEAEPCVRAMLAGLGFTELCPPTECEPTQPQTATPPLDTAHPDEWFSYRYSTRRGQRYTLTLKEIAEKTGYDYGYVRQLHAVWKADKDI